MASIKKALNGSYGNSRSLENLFILQCKAAMYYLPKLIRGAAVHFLKGLPGIRNCNSQRHIEYSLSAYDFDPLITPRIIKNDAFSENVKCAGGPFLVAHVRQLLGYFAKMLQRNPIGVAELSQYP